MKRRTVHDLLTEARSSLRRIDPFRAHAAMQEGALLIEIRSNDERAAHGSIPGSLQIPLSVLEWRVDPDSGHHDPAIGDFGAPIILICAHGYSSSLAARRLQELGFANATDVIGGFEAWKDARLTVSELQANGP
jgi:rhodanese-related sulfurtransferase